MKRRVAILGGGMAGLTAAWSLSPECEVTVYQRGWQLGGKGASGRGAHGRIEEHGLHVWLGYYDNAFRLMREVYAELDRPVTDPECPIATWEDAFLPAGSVGVEERRDDAWSHWVARFGPNDREPGVDAAPLTLAGFMQRALALLLDFSRALDDDPGGVYLSASSTPPRSDVAQLTGVLRSGEITAMIAAVESLRVLRGALPRRSPLATQTLELLERLREDLLERVRDADDARRWWQLIDMVIACLRGCLRDGLIGDPAAFARIDHLDFREWLGVHGAAPDTLESPLIRGMYDLVFAYEEGDPERPRFAAGLGLFLATKMFFDYKGAIFYKLRAGMGDVVFAPLYQALRARGVRFAFFHRVERLHIGQAVEAITLFGGDEYEPLRRYGGLPCFPSEPLREPAPEEPVELRLGRDFDDVVLATSLGTVPSICSELLERSARWRELTGRVKTVATQALQVWMRPSEAELGWPHEGSTVSAYETPFETYASMSHVLPFEEWGSDPPRSLAYFCSSLREGEDPHAQAAAFLERSAGHFWPGALDAEGAFRSELVADQYVRANVDPSDRYVQSLPGSGRARLRADESGCENLFLAGDWTRCGLDAGCIEAAVLSGLQAANAIRGRPLLDGVLGSWPSLYDELPG